MHEWTFDLIAGPYGGTTEGPAWDGQALLFTHIPANRILRYAPHTGTCTECRTGTQGTNGLMFDAQGRLYGCQSGDHCIARFDPDGTMTPLPNRLQGRRHNRPNDLAIDRRGRIWFTDPCGRGRPREERELDHASVLRLDPRPDGTWDLKRMTADTTSPNGILLSQDERTLYVAQSDDEGVRELRAYPLQADDTLGAYAVLHTFGQDARGVHRGVDGMCLDTDGQIIACAGWEEAGPGPMIYVFAPSGRVLETHPVPVDRPTNCTFGGAALGTLYVTSGGGHLFSVRESGRRGWLLYPRS
jgi:gluconolactonase